MPRDRWDDEDEARGRYASADRYEGREHASRGRGGDGDYRDPARRADYRTEHGLTPEDREAIGGPHTDYGRTPGPYAPTAEQAVGRERRSWSGRDPGAWFGRPPHEAPYAEGPHRGRGPKGYTRSSERIREDVNDRLTDDPHLDASEIEVSVTGTEVTLDGTVDSRAAKRRADAWAEDVSGVTHVQNNLRVRPQPGTVAAQTDPRIAAVSEGKDAGQAALDLREERDARSEHPPR